jgi:hypothetical protein
MPWAYQVSWILDINNLVSAPIIALGYWLVVFDGM